MPHTYIDTIPIITDAGDVSRNSLIEIEVWDAFILSHAKCHSRFLVEHSYDQGPWESRPVAIGRTCFRYKNAVWTSTIKPFLNQQRIPVTVRETCSV